MSVIPMLNLLFGFIDMEIIAICSAIIVSDIALIVHIKYGSHDSR